MGLLAMTLACCLAASPVTNAPAPGVDTVAVYAQIVEAIRAELPRGAPEIYLADEQFSPSHGKHPAGLLGELASRGVVDGVFDYERRTRTSPCLDCTRIMLGPIMEYERVLYADPNDLSEEVEPSKGIPVKHWVDMQLVRTCSPEGLRGGSCTEENVPPGRCDRSCTKGQGAGASPCGGGEMHSRRYYFTREPSGALRIAACGVTGVPDYLDEG
ncbi:MAG: hypothetical protein AB1941_28765 [Gemmatimonadota bacterium]